MSEKYEFIDAEYAAYPRMRHDAPAVVQMCEWLEVSRSGFYEWRDAAGIARRRNGGSC